MHESRGANFFVNVYSVSRSKYLSSPFMVPLNFDLFSTRLRRWIISRFRPSQATHWRFVYFISFQCYPLIYVKASKHISSFQISRPNFLFVHRPQFFVSPSNIVSIYWSHKSCLQAHILLIYPSVVFHIFTLIDSFKHRYSPQTFLFGDVISSLPQGKRPGFTLIKCK